MPGSVPIEAASLTQVMTGAGGEMVVIPDDVGNVARDLRALDPTLRVRYATRGGHYVIYQQIDEADGRVVEHFVTTARQLDQRIVRRVEQLVQPDRDAGAALETTLQARRAERAAAFHERVASHGEQLAHALRRDLGVRDRIAVP